MLIGGLTALLLDNTIPGSREERGMLAWHDKTAQQDDWQEGHVYDLPFGLHRLSSHKVSKFVPFLPYYPNKRNQKELEDVASDRPAPENDDITAL